MLIGSEKTPLFAFLASSIKFTSGVITPAAAKADQLRVLRKRNSSGKASSDAGPELAGRESRVAMESPQALMCPLEN